MAIKLGANQREMFKIIKVHQFNDATNNISLSTSPTGEFFNFDWVRARSDTDIFVHGYVALGGNWNSFNSGEYFSPDGNLTRWDITHLNMGQMNGGDDSGQCMVHLCGFIPSSEITSGAGTKTAEVGWMSRDGSNQFLMNRVNPHQVSGRQQSRASNLMIIECLGASQVT